VPTFLTIPPHRHTPTVVCTWDISFWDAYMLLLLHTGCRITVLAAPPPPPPPPPPPLPFGYHYPICTPPPYQHSVTADTTATPPSTVPPFAMTQCFPNCLLLYSYLWFTVCLAGAHAAAFCAPGFCHTLLHTPLGPCGHKPPFRRISCLLPVIIHTTTH